MSDGSTPEWVYVRRSTRPLRTVAWGFLLVFLDFRLNGLDVLPDSLGWVLVVLGAGRLPWRHAGEAVAGAVRTTRVAAGVAAVVALPDLVRSTTVSWSGTAPSGTVALLGLLGEVLALVAGVRLADAAAGLAASAGDAASQGAWSSLRRWYLVAGVVGLVALVGLLAGVPLAPLVVVGVVLELVNAVWLVYRCFADSSQPWSLPGWLPAPRPVPGPAGA